DSSQRPSRRGGPGTGGRQTTLHAPRSVFDRYHVVNAARPPGCNGDRLCARLADAERGTDVERRPLDLDGTLRLDLSHQLRLEIGREVGRSVTWSMSVSPSAW